MITPGQLHSVFPSCQNPGTWCRTFDQIVDEFDLRRPQRLTMWLAQCGHESASFNVLRERMSYRTPAAIRDVWPSRFPTDESAVPYVLNPNGLANFAYAGRNGNGDVASGDGFRFRGGGLIQLTGRGNYREGGEHLGLDLETRPMQIESQLVAARTAAFFWVREDLNVAADAGDFDRTTFKVNGPAMQGHDERRDLWKKLVAQNLQ